VKWSISQMPYAPKGAIGVKKKSLGMHEVEAMEV
jgi:hypothetical protein